VLAVGLCDVLERFCWSIIEKRDRASSCHPSMPPALTTASQKSEIGFGPYGSIYHLKRGRNRRIAAQIQHHSFPCTLVFVPFAPAKSQEAYYLERPRLHQSMPLRNEGRSLENAIRSVVQHPSSWVWSGLFVGTEAMVQRDIIKMIPLGSDVEALSFPLAAHLSDIWSVHHLHTFTLLVFRFCDSLSCKPNSSDCFTTQKTKNAKT